MQLSFKYESITIGFEVIFRKRQTMAIKVEAPDKITVIVPIGTSKKVIIEKVQEKASWIYRKLDYYKNIQYLQAPREFVHGELFMYLGQDYILNIEINDCLPRARLELNKEKLFLRTPLFDKNLIEKVIKGWYRQKAREKIEERLSYYLPKIPKKPNRIVVKEQKSRWGSCSSKGNLNFNWKIIMAPIDVLDYIVVHELCHLVFLNHSKEFWNMVAAILPDYKLRKEWLKRNGFRMNL